MMTANYEGLAGCLGQQQPLPRRRGLPPSTRNCRPALH